MNPKNETIKDNLNQAIKTAMREKSKDRLSTLRFITAAIKQKEIDTRTTLEEPEVLAILDKLVKQLRESIKSYQDAGRDELVEKETQQLKIVQEFLPQPLSNSEIEMLIQEAIQKTQASSMRDMGKVMGILKPTLQGRADLQQVSQKIKTLLGA